MPGTRTVSRCAECGALLLHLTEPVGKLSEVRLCFARLQQCEHFDPPGRFECNQPIPARVSPKDKLNNCPLYSIRVMVEKETSSNPPNAPTMPAPHSTIYSKINYLKPSLLREDLAATAWNGKHYRASACISTVDQVFIGGMA